MSTVGLWQIESGSPKRLSSSDVELEQDLESWIEHDPGMLEHGLTIVGRQLRTDGGPLDLLAVDAYGRWVLIEIKRERLRRSVIAQAIDYASCLEQYDTNKLREHCDEYLKRHSNSTIDTILAERGTSLEAESELGLQIYLVGTGVDPGLERMVGYLSDTVDLGIRIVTFSVFLDAAGKKLLAREIHEPQDVASGTSSARREQDAVPDHDELLNLADRNGVGGIVRKIIHTIEDLGLYPRRYSKSFMIAPPKNKTRVLIYVPVGRQEYIQDGRLAIGIAPEAFEQFYGIAESDVRDALMKGAEEQMRLSENSGDVFLDSGNVDRFTDSLRSLFAECPTFNSSMQASPTMQDRALP